MKVMMMALIQKCKGTVSVSSLCVMVRQCTIEVNDVSACTDEGLGKRSPSQSEQEEEAPAVKKPQTKQQGIDSH